MTSLSKELVFLILQFLEEERFEETARKLEQESGLYFNLMYFEDQVMTGAWEAAEKYLSGFTKIEDNLFSRKIFFDMRKQKYLEALDKNDWTNAIDILRNDLQIFASFNEKLFTDITQLLTLENFRQNEELIEYEDIKTERTNMMVEIRELIQDNPILRDRLKLPSLANARLRTLINQSLNWQHQRCKNPKPNPDIKTLFVDHVCSPVHAPPLGNSPFMGVLPEHGDCSQIVPFTPFQPPPAAMPPFTVCIPSPTVANDGGVAFNVPSSSAASLKHPRTSSANSAAIGCSLVDTYHSSKRVKPVANTGKIGIPANIPSINSTDQNSRASSCSLDILPRFVGRILNAGTAPVSMDFHPLQQTILLVGTNTGNILCWEVVSRKRLVLRRFTVSNLGACSLALQAALVNNPIVSVNRVTWSPDGSLFGVAFSKHMVQIYTYRDGSDVRLHLEVDAHVGGVNDLAFSTPNKQLCAVTCGDDGMVKVWDVVNGTKQYMFEGHETPVYSVCPHQRENVPFLFSASFDGKIKAWIYGNHGSIISYNAPGNWCTRMAYSGDGSRIFSCGTSREGEAYLIEWNKRDGTVKRTYEGFQKRSLGIVQFDTAQNRFLAAGDESLIKFWEMDNEQLVASVDAAGDLPASPRIRFNKEGSLLAVSTNDNRIKILANADGLLLFDDPLAVAEASTKTDEARSMLDVKLKICDERVERSMTWNVLEISHQSQLRSLRLPDTSNASKISQLVYTNSGVAILALASNAMHMLWKWQISGDNTNGKATTSVSPQVWQPMSDILMTNDVSDLTSEEAVSCFALSKNDSYVVSTSGGKISLFNTTTFEAISTFIAPPPTATFLVFHPHDNNMIAIGMDDSTIWIYNIPADEVESMLRGHFKRITGLAFSSTLNLLISCGADSQICVWEIVEWGMQKSIILPLPSVADTTVQFNHDQTSFLVVHACLFAVYDATKLECSKQWISHEYSAPISGATFSCNSQLIYATFFDATICIFTAADLELCCRINPSAYVPVFSLRPNAYPSTVTAHPLEPLQFCIGLSNGEILVFEPPESEENWGIALSSDKGSAGSVRARATASY